MLQLSRAEERSVPLVLSKLTDRLEKLLDQAKPNDGILTLYHKEFREAVTTLRTTEHSLRRAQSEAKMWREQLFERMKLLEENNQLLNNSNSELSKAMEEIGKVQQSQRRSHEELSKRDEQRLALERDISSLRDSQRQSYDRNSELLASLGEAKKAMKLMRQDLGLYEREVSALKSLGAALAEKFKQASEQKARTKENLLQTRDLLRVEVEKNTALTAEVERLKKELAVSERKRAQAQASPLSFRDRENNSSAKGRFSVRGAKRKMQSWFALSQEESVRPSSDCPASISTANKAI